LHVIGASSWREPIDIVLIRNRSTGSKTLDRFWDELSVRGLSGSLA
jgi:hypothetical protein